MSPSPRVLVLGLGNDLLRDDAIGLRVVTAVQERLPAASGVTVRQTSEMGLGLLDWICGFERLVLVDAVQTGQAPPGYVHELDGWNLKVLPAGSPHLLGLGECLALGRRLEMPVPAQVRILAVEVEDPYTLSTAMSPALEAALPQVVERVLQAVGR